jgi:hypothetical protein
MAPVPMRSGTYKCHAARDIHLDRAPRRALYREGSGGSVRLNAKITLRTGARIIDKTWPADAIECPPGDHSDTRAR